MSSTPANVIDLSVYRERRAAARGVTNSCSPLQLPAAVPFYAPAFFFGWPIWVMTPIALPVNGQRGDARND